MESDRIRPQFPCDQGCDTGDLHEEGVPPHQLAGRDDVWWVEEVPEESAPRFIPLISPKGNRSTLRGVVVSHRAVAAYTHWYQERSCPCVGARGDCALCRDGHARRLKGYLPVLLPMQKLAILELTSEALRSNPKILELAAQLRGWSFSATRIGENRNSRMAVRFTPPTPKTEKEVEHLPADLDVRRALATIWGLSR